MFKKITIIGGALLVGLLAFPSLVMAQSYDLLLKGGHVIDPKSHINAVRDVAIKDGKIAEVAANIPASEAKKVIDVSGYYVTPGIIDIHTHVFWGANPQYGYGGGYNGLQPDYFTFRAGVTTIVDAGSSGWRTFPIFKKRVIDHAKTRVLAFLNIVGHGMRGNPIEQNVKDMNPKLTAMRARQYSDIIVGIKLAHFRGHDWIAAKRAEKASKLAAGIPLMVDFGSAKPPLSIKKLFFDVMKPGDIFTHCFAHLEHFNPHSGRMAVVDKNFNVRPFVLKAQKRGIVFDVGHGGGSFGFHVATAAMKQGLMPNSLSTDMHIGNVNGGLKNMANLMSKFLALPNETLYKVIKQSTWNPAQEINRPNLGNLSPGVPADVAVFDLKHGEFGYVDAYGGRMMGDKKLVAVLTIKGGDIVWDLNGMTYPSWKKIE